MALIALPALDPKYHAARRRAPDVLSVSSQQMSLHQAVFGTGSFVCSDSTLPHFACK